MVICLYFMKGNCRFGERCWNEHPQSGASIPSSTRTEAGHGLRYNLRYSAGFVKQSHFQGVGIHGMRLHNENYAPRGRGYSFPSEMDSHFSAVENKNDQPMQMMIGCIQKDIASWHESGQWLLSCYSPSKEQSCISGFVDHSPEELRFEFYCARVENDLPKYAERMRQRISAWHQRKNYIVQMNGSTKASLIVELAGKPVPQQRTFPSTSQVAQFDISDTLNGFGAPGFGAPAAPGFGAPAAPGFGAPAAPGFGAPAVPGFGAPAPQPFGSGIPVLGSFPRPTVPTPAFSSTTAVSFNFQMEVRPLLPQSSPASKPPVYATSTSTIDPLPMEVYTSIDLLTAEELEQFKVQEFSVGRIPIKPPPIELLTVAPN
uniref:nucleoporin NUP42 isoform X1 n=2 Tax=Myxine glutinosa TaxID=7769 RepID=UPI00358E9EB4